MPETKEHPITWEGLVEIVLIIFVFWIFIAGIWKSIDLLTNNHKEPKLTHFCTTTIFMVFKMPYVTATDTPETIKLKNEKLDLETELANSQQYAQCLNRAIDKFNVEQ